MSTERIDWKGVAISIERTPNGHRAMATIPTRKGPVVYSVEAKIPDVLWEYLAAYAPEGSAEVSGGFFDDIGKAFSDMTRSQAFEGITRVVSDVASNPLFGVALGAVAGPAAMPIAQTVGSLAKAAHSLAGRARSGDPKAQREVGAIARRAKRGDPKARRAAQLIREAARQQRQSGPRLDQQPRPAASSSPFGELAATMAEAAAPLAYDAMVSAFETRKGDGSYEVSGAAVPTFKTPPPYNPYCGNLGCHLAGSHSHRGLFERQPW